MLYADGTTHVVGNGIVGNQTSFQSGATDTLGIVRRDADGRTVRHRLVIDYLTVGKMSDACKGA